MANILAFATHLAILMCIYAILAVSLNLALGYTGLLSLAHVALFGIGAYTSALLVRADVPFIFAFIAAGLITAAFGFFLVYATRKLKGDYLALATFGFALVIESVQLNWRSLTRGPLGIPGIPKPELFGFVIKSNFAYFVFVLIIAAASIYIIYKIVKSPFGRLLEATRDDEIGLTALGKDTFKLKAKSMMISAFFAGLAGSLFAHYITYIDPTSFSLVEIVLVLTIVIVGGLASVKGSVLATIVLLLIPELLRFVNLPSTVLGPLRQIIYLVILLLILLYRPKGFFGRVDLH